MRVDEGLSPTDQADLDRLELELRKLPEVVAVGFEGPTVGSPVTEDAVVTVHVFVADPALRSSIEQQALDLGRLHLGRPLRVLVAPESEPGGAAPAAAAVPRPSRAQLVGVALSDDGAEALVTMTHLDQRSTGRGPSGALSGTAEATLAALRQLGWSVPFAVVSCVRVALGGTGAVLVHLTGGEGERLGVSSGDTPELAAAKATLQALNRWLEDPARRPAVLSPPA